MPWQALAGYEHGYRPESKNAFNRVRYRTAELVLYTMMLNGVSLFLLGILATTLFELSLASRLAPRLASNTGKASSTVGFPVGVLLVTLDLGKGNAFPATKDGVGLLVSTNLFLNLVLLKFFYHRLLCWRSMSIEGQGGCQSHRSPH
jgi:hypothetical protein